MDWRKTRSFGGSSPAPSPDEKPAPPPGSVSDVRLTQPIASDKPSPPPDFSKTQVLPVEEMAKVLGPRKAGAQRAPFDGARTQRLTASQLRAPPRARGRWRSWLLACVLAALALGAYVGLRDEASPRAAVSPAGSTRAVVEASGVPAVNPAGGLRVVGKANGARAVAATATTEPASSRTSGAALASPAGSAPRAASPSAAWPEQRLAPPPNARNVTQRSAIDALAAGDASRAAALYSALAARDPNDRALTTAARILHARATRAQQP